MSNAIEKSATIRLVDSPIIQAGGQSSVAMERLVEEHSGILLNQAMKGMSESQIAECEVVLTLKLNPRED